MEIDKAKDLRKLGNAAEGGSAMRVTLIRTIACGLAMVPLALLVATSQLEPNSSGLGTHQQLGLPPCTMRILAGMRCPGCGMTTSWAHFVRGQWASSAYVHVGGFLLAFYGLGFSATCMRTGWTGRLPGSEVLRNLTTSLLAIVAISIATWLWKLNT